MRIPLSGLMLAIALVAHSRADFVVTPASEAPQGPSAGKSHSPDPALDPGLHKSTVAFQMAYGFGNRIPLAFAVRQIVPGWVRVSYGPGANPRSLVDWRGGQPWNQALSAAVKPLGLQVVLSYKAIEIRK